jgi:hypothetical protein
MEAVWKKCHSLKAFLDPSNFKSYDELKARLNKVLGVDGFTSRSAVASLNDEADLPWQQEAPAPTLKAKPAPKFDEDEDDEDMLLFAKIANS